MNSAESHIDKDLINYLKNKYFGDQSKRLSIKNGQQLINHNEPNDRLYLVLEGLCAGYLTSESGTKYQVFQSAKNTFVGVHSFFSKTSKVYADVIALEDCKVAYIERDDLVSDSNQCYNDDFMPLIVHELSIRQRWAKDVTLEKEATMKMLYHTDKMATLGQMAAGLAHELNNAIGVIHGNSDWMAKEMSTYFKANEEGNIFDDFQRGLEKGQFMASNEIRTQKRKFEKKYKLSSVIAKLAAKIGFSERDIEDGNKDAIEKLIEQKHKFWQYGVALHDVLLASNQAAHVLKSVKQLSVSDHARYTVSVNRSLNEALTLLKNHIRDISLELTLEEGLPHVSASAGELIQIWVNIIKNACESMTNSGVSNPTLVIKSYKHKSFAVVDIEDNGPGISKELQEKIFQPNFTTKKGGLSFGLGLGLSIVQKLVDGYKGSITVNSKKGKTKFSIKIPLN